ncbi:RNA ligase RtcB family protein, partial [Escherichia coli]|nr:RNA ligase RtcB family protein [Escherichia coli]EFF9776240.1 RNA ligase RtcB family protein [Escherichia coli]HAH2530880.1 RNA ligase RtcB family protein [Escherichia coli]HAH2531785.1 RNA ligase RtcB family protein [Escherichia coli]
SLFYSGILPRFRIMVCLKAVTMRYGTLRNMTMRWHLRVLIAR